MLSESRQVYGMGSNEYGQLSMLQTTNPRKTAPDPILLDSLRHISVREVISGVDFFDPGAFQLRGDGREPFVQLGKGGLWAARERSIDFFPQSIGGVSEDQGASLICSLWAGDGPGFDVRGVCVLLRGQLSGRHWDGRDFNSGEDE